MLCRDFIKGEINCGDQNMSFFVVCFWDFLFFFPGCKYVNLEERRGALLHFDPRYPEFTTTALNKP